MATTSELTLHVVIHPDPLPKYPHKILVVHPTVDVLTKGAPALGWEGDNRLAVYLDTMVQRFQLWRLEHDNQYRLTAQLPPNAQITPETMNSLIERLVQHDAHRGFDANREVAAAAAKADAANDKMLSEVVTEHIAPKLRWAMIKDGF